MQNKLKLALSIGCGILAAILIGISINYTKQTDDSHLEIKYTGENLPISVQGLGENVEDYKEAIYRITELDSPTDTSSESFEIGLGYYTTIDSILNRILPDGSNPFQCSRYTAYLATGQWSYNQELPDYGPVNGKDIAEYLVKYYGFKYIDKPVKGAIGSGFFNTKYGHTVLYLYSTGENTAMVNDANFVPLSVATHNMNIEGFVWVVPGSYEPEPEPVVPDAPKCDIRNVVKGDTLGQIMFECTGKIEWGDAMLEYAKHWHSTKFKLFNSVYDGWISENGVGLFAGDVIQYLP